MLTVEDPRTTTLLALANEDVLTSAQAADTLGCTRTTAGALLRALERDGLLHGELIGGGFLGYELTADGRGVLQHRVVARSRQAA